MTDRDAPWWPPAATAPKTSRCGCATDPRRGIFKDGDPYGCYCDCSDTGRDDCEHADACP